MKRVALYVRVSHEEQVKHGISVDAQIKALKDYSKANNYKVVNIYSDAGISARKSYKKRPALLEMIEDCREGKIDLILICKLDRFFRSVSDYYAVMEQIGNVPWKAIQEDYETETSSGVFKVNIMLSVAQSEADKTSERIKAVFDYKRQRGEALSGKPPTGYMYKDGKFYKNPKTQKGVEAFFRTYLTTFNKKAALKAARDLGVWISDETGRHMMYCDSYHGVIPYIMESYITPEEHEIILSHKKTTVRKNKYSYIFSGLCKCGKCKRFLGGTTSVKHRQNGSTYIFPQYVCDFGRRNLDCEGSLISEKNLEAFMLNSLEDELDKYNSQITLGTQKDNTDKLKRCHERLDRIKLLFEMGDMEINVYKQKRDELLSEIESCTPSKTKKPIHLEKNWKELYNNLDAEHKNSFWKQIIDHLEVPSKKAKEVKIFFK